MSETCSRVRVGKHLSVMFRIKNGFKQRYEISRLLCNFDLECAI